MTNGDTSIRFTNIIDTSIRVLRAQSFIVCPMQFKTDACSFFPPLSFFFTSWDSRAISSPTSNRCHPRRRLSRFLRIGRDNRWCRTAPCPSRSNCHLNQHERTFTITSQRGCRVWLGFNEPYWVWCGVGSYRDFYCSTELWFRSSISRLSSRRRGRRVWSRWNRPGKCRGNRAGCSPNNKIRHWLQKKTLCSLHRRLRK